MTFEELFRDYARKHRLYKIGTVVLQVLTGLHMLWTNLMAEIFYEPWIITVSRSIGATALAQCGAWVVLRSVWYLWYFRRLTQVSLHHQLVDPRLIRARWDGVQQLLKMVTKWALPWAVIAGYGVPIVTTVLQWAA